MLVRRSLSMFAITLVAMVCFPGIAQATVRTFGLLQPQDCSADVTSAFQTFLDTKAVDGDTIQLPAGACFRLDGTLHITDRHNLTFVGLSGGATLKRMTTPPTYTRQDMFDITGGSGITVQNVTFQSTNTNTTYQPDREWVTGIEVSGSSGILLDNVHGVNIWGDFVQIGPDTRPATDVMADDVTLQNSTVDRAGRHGISCGGCTNTVIDNNRFTNIAYHSFDLEIEAAAWYADHVSFTNNDITGYQRLGVVANQGMGTHVTYVTITGNDNTTATLPTCQPPVQVLDTAPTKDHWTISSNSFDTLGVGLDINGVDYVTAQSNVINLLHGGCTNQTTAITASNTHNDLVTGNDFQGADTFVQSGATLTGTACGNRLSLLGTAFNRPTAC